MARYEFSTEKYTAAHGKAPEGSRFWVFWCKEGGEVWASGSLARAKRRAADMYRTLGIDPCVIYLLP